MPVALPQIVIRPSFRGITEDFPCSIDPLNLSNRLLRSSVLVRVPCQRQTTPQSSDLFAGCVVLDPQCSVVVR